MRLLRSAVVAAGLITAWLIVASATALAAGPGSVRVAPDPGAPGTSETFVIQCTSAATSATLFGQKLGLDEHIAMHSIGRSVLSKNVFSATVTLPMTIRPGTYHPEMKCSDGTSNHVSLTVNAVPGAGGVRTGDGTTATATNDAVAAAGFAAVGLGVLLGVFALLRRRRSRT